MRRTEEFLLAPGGPAETRAPDTVRPAGTKAAPAEANTTGYVIRG
jgi:hypothetical protein